MDFAILGSVEAVSDGRVLPLGGPRQRALLARLLVDANRVVSADRLSNDLWEAPPQDVHGALQNQVSRLRKVLGDRLVTKAPGYLVRVEPGELDLDRFRSLVAEAGSTADLASRSRLLREADGLFRGAPLADVDAPFAASEAAALDELRLAAVEGRVDADLERGRHAELVPELGALVRASPLRERLRGQQILALYRCGRQADALDAYRATKRMLDEELGLEPSPALRELERAILTQDESLAAAATVADEPTPAPVALVEARRGPRWGRIALIAACVVLLLAVASAAAVLATLTTSSVTTSQSAVNQPVIAAVAVDPAQSRKVPKSVTHATSVRAKPAKHVVQVVQQVVHQASAAKPRRVVAPKAVTPKKKKKNVTPAPVTAPTPKPKTPTTTVATISDAFDGNGVDGTIWYQSQSGSGWTLNESGGHLEYAFTAGGVAGGQYTVIGGHLGTMCKFPGDFDAQVDFRLPQWPGGNGIAATLWAWFGPTTIGRYVWRQSSAKWGEAYSSDTGENAGVPLNDTSGSLRLARVGGILTAYFMHNGHWQTLTSNPMDGVATLAVGAWGDDTFGGKPVVVDFNNFSVTGANPTCPAGSQPGTP
jgi:DNA-binding SARP family transcriptional activator